MKSDEPDFENFTLIFNRNNCILTYVEVIENMKISFEHYHCNSLYQLLWKLRHFKKLTWHLLTLFSMRENLFMYIFIGKNMSIVEYKVG